jgi:hypothetical protein
MEPARSFLGDARGRLLPPSIPFRFFGAAAFFHLLAWVALSAGATQAVDFEGGLGWPLGSLHLITLGVLVMSAIGASLQLLPVATRQAVAAARLLAGLWWSYTVGVTALTTAMVLSMPALLGAAAVWLVVVLVAYALLLGRNLARGRGMKVVLVHGWAALACLLGLLASGLLLAASYRGLAFVDHAAALRLHISLAAYGFMGLLALGLSHILLPMFALADAPAQRPALVSAALVIAGLALTAATALGALPIRAGSIAIGCGLGGLALHVTLMEGTIRRGMRRRLGRPFLLIRLGWAALAASLLVALALDAEAGFARLHQLFVVLVVGGLLSFLLGVMSRIVPFLASMHAPAGRRGAQLPSSLTSESALAIHFTFHLGALALLVAAVMVDSVWLARAAGLLGSAGAIAFGAFFVHAWRRMRAASAPAL